MNEIIHGIWQEELPKLESNSIDLIIIDPPYLTTKSKWDKEEQVNEELSKELYRIVKETASLYVWCGIGEKSQSLIRWFPIFSEHWHFKDLITWKKQRGMGNRRGWLYTREEIMWFVKDNKKFIWNSEYQYSDVKRSYTPTYKGIGRLAKSDYKRYTNIWDDIMEIGQGSSIKNSARERNLYKHYTPKPEKAIERIIKLHTVENDVILDCFLGSGTTIAVAKKMNRRYMGIEKDKEFCEFSNERVRSIEI